VSRIQCCSGRSPFSLKKGSDPIRFSIPDRDSSTHGVDLPCRPRSTPTNSSRERQRAPSRQIAGTCRRRGGSASGGVSRMDAATELTWTYLQRPPLADLPRHPGECRRLPLTLPWFRRVRGAARPTTPQSCSRWYVATSSQPISRAWRARRSARNTERCLPPVQPKATVT